MAVLEYTTYISDRGIEFIILISHLYFTLLPDSLSIIADYFFIIYVYAKTSSPSFSRVTNCGIFVL